MFKRFSLTVQFFKKSLRPKLLREKAVKTRERSLYILFYISKGFWIKTCVIQRVFGSISIMSSTNSPAGAGSMASGVPKPGAFVTPQAGARGQNLTVQQFFDPSTYRGKMVGLPPMAPSEKMSDLTPENIKIFFDPQTYHGKTVGLPPMTPPIPLTGLRKEDMNTFFGGNTHHGYHRSLQKRPAEAVTHPSKMSKMELLEKFKLAAELNGVCWKDIAVSHICISCFATNLYLKKKS